MSSDRKPTPLGVYLLSSQPMSATSVDNGSARICFSPSAARRSYSAGVIQESWRARLAICIFNTDTFSRCINSVTCRRGASRD